MIYNRETDRSRGCGFVTMSTVEEAEKAGVQSTNEEGNLIDGEVATQISDCVRNWKVAAVDEKKKMWEIFDETGIFTAL